MADFNLQLVVKAIDRATKPLQRIGAAASHLAGETGLGSVARAGANVGRSLGPVLRETRRLALRAGVAIGALGAATFGLLKSFSGAGDRAAKFGRQLGINVEWLQRHQGAAELAGINTDTFNMALQRFTRRSAEAAAGSGEAQGALKFLGIELKDVEGNIRPVEQLLPEVADALAKVENPALRTRIAFKLFDSEGVAMVKMLGEGSEAMARQAAQAERLGRVIGADATRQSEEFNDSLLLLRWSLEGVRNVIGARLMPLVQPLVVQLREWIVANRELIGTRLEEFIAAVVERVPAFIQQLREIGQGFLSVGRVVWPVIEWLGGLKFVVIALAGILSAKLLISLAGTAWSIWKLGVAVGAYMLPALVAVGAAIGNFITALRAGYSAVAAFNLVLAANPIGVVIAAVVALAGAAYLIYRNWDGLVAFFGDVWDGVTAAFDKGLEWIETALGKVWSRLEAAALGVKAVFVGVVAEIVSAVASLVDRLPDFVTRGAGLDGIRDFANRIEAERQSIEQRRQELRGAPGGTVVRREETARRNTVDLNVRIDQEGRARLRDVRSDSDDVDVNVDSGLVMVGG